MTNKIQNIYIYIYWWMKLVGVAPSSSTCIRKWGGSTNGQGKTTRHDNEQQGSEAKMGGAQEVLEKGKE